MEQTRRTAVTTGAPRFDVGAPVRVLPATGDFSRTPAWTHGRTGTVRMLLGAWAEPEAVSRGERTPPSRHLYQVEFEGSDGTLAADVFEHWLAPA
jgi:hypothetical protein